MRHHPVLIHRIAVEPARQMVIHSALRHLLQRGGHNVEQLRVPGFQVALHQQVNGAGMRKLGRGAEPAMLRVEHLYSRFHNVVNQVRPE